MQRETNVAGVSDENTRQAVGSQALVLTILAPKSLFR
jgi:hypothetical protein